MRDTAPSFLELPDGSRLAYRATPGRPPTVVFLGGFTSDMTGTKATALEGHCRARGRAFLRFDPVLRRFNGADFQLQPGITLDRYGLWPELPSSLPVPSEANGSPTFIAAGTDDSGVTVYVRVGDSPDNGFAVAPGTAPSDPAAGNPGWTWWLPAR